MARPRIAKTKEEAAAVPVDQPVQIVLEEEGVVAAAQEEPPKTEEPAPKKAAPPPVEQELEPETEKPDVGSLQAQIEALKKAEKAVQEQLAAERRRAEDAERQRETFRTESSKNAEEALQAKYDAIVNAMEAQKESIESAKRDLRNAEISADIDARVEATVRMTQAQAALAQLDAGKTAIEAQAEAVKNAPKAEPQQTNQFEAAIAQLPPKAKDWMRSHPEYITDARKNRKIQTIHDDAVEAGHSQFSDGYFDYIDTALGYKEKPKPKVEAEVEYEEEPAPQRSRVVTQAPPTRDVPSAATGKPASSNKVTLTAEQREFARLSGVDEVTYARQVQKLEQLKRNGHYNERG